MEEEEGDRAGAQGARGLLVPVIEDSVEAPQTCSGLPATSNPGGQVANRRPSRGWLYATIILCCYGFFKEFKASEPFLTPYLVDPDFKNFTKNQVSVLTL